MKSNLFRRVVAIMLCLIMALSVMSVSFTVSARYTDEDIDNKISYHELNCREDDCDCLEPENNRFAVVSPVGGNNTYNDYILVDTYQAVQQYFDEQGWTDGLPIVPPTWIKAEKFMRYTPYSDNDVVAVVNGRNITAYQVAVNAIMSGCSAEYLPVCIAFVEALGNDAYLDSLRSGKLTPMMYVNGPIARQLGIDNTQGMTTEECNIAIGRFMELALINLAGLERNNAFGNVQPLVFSEDEQNCINIGWDPYHVQQGYDLNDNVITATSFSMWGNNVTPATDLPEEIMKVMAWDITEKNLGGLGGLSVEENSEAHRVILITPSVAQALAKKYQSKDALETALVETARRPLWMRTYAYYYANTGGALSKSFSEVYNELKEAASEDAKTTASPSWMNGITYAEIDTVATMTKGNTAIVIQGDESRNKTQVMPGGVSVSKEIQLDTTWDDLLASMVISIVYQPLSAHYITAVDNTVKLPASDGIPTELQVTKTTTYTVAASASYAKSQNRIYYDSATSTLYYGDGTTAHTVVLDTEKYADFITLIETIGRNGTIKLNNKNTITAVKAAFKTNKNFADQNLISYTDSTFGSVPLTIAYTSSTNTSSLDGAFMTISSGLTTFTADLGGDIVMGDTTDVGFVTVDGTTVTVDASVKAGATAVIGVSDGSGTYRTMTFVNGGDGTYKITYNTANTLTLTSSSYYLKGTFNNWEATDAFVKTGNSDIISVIKEISAGTYTFKVHNAGSDEWFGNGGTITDTANRWTMDSSDNCTFTATGGTYEFKYEISTNKLSVYEAQSDFEPAPTTKTVYIGVIEYIKDFVPTLHYWNDSIGLAGDATLTATGDTVKYSVGSSYWSNTEQNFKVYKTSIPVNATNMKTWDKGANGKWASESVAYANNQILLLFEYGGTYHNITASYTYCEHNEVEVLSAVGETCTSTGLTEGKKCVACGKIIVAQTVIPQKGHTEVTVKGKDASCTDTGLTDGKKCSVCSEVTVEQTVIPAKGHSWDNGVCSVCGDVCEHSYADSKCTICGNVKDTASKVEGYSISLGGNIAVNFHMTFDKAVLDDTNAMVVFTLPDNSRQTVYVKDAEVTTNGYYVFTSEITAIQMSSTIKAQVVATDYKSEVYSYSVLEYADYILQEAEAGNTDYTDVTPLVKAMLNYGANAQLYFEYNTDNLANKNLEQADKVLADVNLSSYKPMTTGKETGVRHHGTSLTLKSETVINVYFVIEDEENIPEFYVNGVLATPVKVNNLYRIRIEDIAAQNLDNEYAVTVGGLQVKYSALSYGYSAMYTNNEILKNVVRAMYAYNKAAEAYLSNEG